MKLYRNLILALAFAAGAMFSSCEKEPKTQNPVDEPSQETVSLKSSDNTQEFSLTHDKDGVHGTVEFSLTANLSNPVDKDVTVKFAASCEGISSSKITLTPAEAKIAAGSATSSAVKVSISDWSELAGTEAEGTYTVTVKISSVSGAENVSADAKSTVSASVSKSAKDNGSDPDPDPTPDPDPEPTPGEITLTMQTSIDDTYRWTNEENTSFVFNFYTKDGDSELENPEVNSVIGNGNSDVARDNGLICFEVDFTQVKNLSGLYFRHWGQSYCPQASRIYYSDNGTEWIYVGTIENGTTPSYYAMFSETLSTRYIKYEMTLPSVNGRIDILQFGPVYKVEE